LSRFVQGVIKNTQKSNSSLVKSFFKGYIVSLGPEAVKIAEETQVNSNITTNNQHLENTRNDFNDLGFEDKMSSIFEEKMSSNFEDKMSSNSSGQNVLTSPQTKFHKATDGSSYDGVRAILDHPDLEEHKTNSEKVLETIQKGKMSNKESWIHGEVDLQFYINEILEVITSQSPESIETLIIKSQKEIAKKITSLKIALMSLDNGLQAQNSEEIYPSDVIKYGAAYSPIEEELSKFMELIKNNPLPEDVNQMIAFLLLSAEDRHVIDETIDQVTHMLEEQNMIRKGDNVIPLSQ